MIITKRLQISKFCTSVLKYLTPFALNLQPTPEIPTLQIKSQKILVQNWWSESPFQNQGDLRVPVFSFIGNQYLGRSVDIPAQIFNQPLRRDLIYRLHHFRNNLDKFTTVKTRNRAETSGSGAKIRPQKKTGKARQGEKRAPHLHKGGKAFGKIPRVYSFHLNSKIKLKALECLLTSKLVEGKIKIIDEQSIEEPKTKFVNQAIRTHEKDERTIFCIITSKDVNPNFVYAQRNIKQVIWHDSYSVDVHSLFIADKIFITLKGLEELIDNMRKTKYVIYRQPHMPENKQQQSSQEKTESSWDPEKPYEFKFKILAEYLQLYEKTKQQAPELLNKEMTRIRKVQKFSDIL